jgi:hypothetical protein
VAKFFTLKKKKEKRHPQRAFNLMNLPPEVNNPRQYFVECLLIVFS